MAPNHSGDTIESILGPIGSHWFQKMGQNCKKLPCPKIRIFDYPAVIDFSHKMEVTVMAPNHGGDPLGSILGPMGSHWVKKMGQNRQKLPCPQVRIFDYPAVIDFSQKMEVTVMAPNHGGDTIESILGPVGFHWVQKIGQNRKKLPCPKIRIFYYPAVIGFSQKMEVTVMAPNHGRDPLGFILGPMGSHWVKKNGSKPLKITMPQNSNFRLPRRHRFFPKNGSYGYGAKSRCGTPRVHLGASGVPLVKKKFVKTVKNYHTQKFEFSITDFSQKMEVTVMAPNHDGDLLGSILGPVGSHWVKKMGQNRKKLPCPKIRIFYYLAVIDFLQKVEVTVMAPNHGGDTIEYMLGPMGSHWVQKMGQNR